jgi:hypothetical protein
MLKWAEFAVSMEEMRNVWYKILLRKCGGRSLHDGAVWDDDKLKIGIWLKLREDLFSVEMTLNVIIHGVILQSKR